MICSTIIGLVISKGLNDTTPFQLNPKPALCWHTTQPQAERPLLRHHRTSCVLSRCDPRTELVDSSFVVLWFRKAYFGNRIKIDLRGPTVSAQCII